MHCLTSKQNKSDISSSEQESCPHWYSQIHHL